MEDKNEGIIASADRKKKEKPHVTWDEEQIAEHNKTRGQKMKIDEPKTPYVTEEEFKKLCEEDPDYQKEFGNAVDFNSQEAENDSEMSDDRIDDKSQLKKGINFEEVEYNSDDDLQGSGKKSNKPKMKRDLQSEYFEQR